ncbi:hypothetical protein [Thalassobacillus sp. CUG 92003]|uniref:hypothetical protein n=1 Tax=Thalassobacillus sp. CUG 92003 TaxID=2736641 RepID=UPI0015E770E4|nr:hypothetical protein [Thalassobacillus sp. CUG 92003]
MENNNGNIVMFPGWKTTLEKEGLEAVRKKRYQEALDKFKPLFDYNVASKEVVTAQLVSLMELGQYEPAEELCQQLMKTEENDYFEYLHIYLTILFQTSRYQELVDLLDEIFESEEIPQQSRTQYWHLYEVSKKLLEESNVEMGSQFIQEWKRSIESEDLHKQWKTISKLKEINAQPFVEPFIDFLTSQSGHPIIKTGVIQWLQESKVDREIPLYKLGVTEKINPAHLKELRSDYVKNQIQLRLSNIEQQNPTLYKLLDQLLYRYMFVRYPLFPMEEEVPSIVQALKYLGHLYLQMPFDDKLNEETHHYIEEIQLCEQHYSLIIGE